MLFEEFTDPILPERKSKDQEEPAGYTDPELARTLDRVAVHYPYYKRGVEGFMKYAQRAIRHSEENDQTHAEKIDALSAEIEQLKDLIAKLQQR